MRVALDLCGLVALVIGFGGCTMARTSVGEIQGTLVVVIGTLFMCAGAVVHAMESNSKKDREALARLVDALGPGARKDP